MCDRFLCEPISTAFSKRQRKSNITVIIIEVWNTNRVIILLWTKVNWNKGWLHNTVERTDIQIRIESPEIEREAHESRRKKLEIPWNIGTIIIIIIRITFRDFRNSFAR